jgi:hypothetical protein
LEKDDRALTTVSIIVLGVFPWCDAQYSIPTLARAVQQCAPAKADLSPLERVLLLQLFHSFAPHIFKPLRLPQKTLRRFSPFALDPQ